VSSELIYFENVSEAKEFRIKDEKQEVNAAKE